MSTAGSLEEPTCFGHLNPWSMVSPSKVTKVSLHLDEQDCWWFSDRFWNLRTPCHVSPFALHVRQIIRDSSTADVEDIEKARA